MHYLQHIHQTWASGRPLQDGKYFHEITQKHPSLVNGQQKNFQLPLWVTVALDMSPVGTVSAKASSKAKDNVPM